MQPEFPPTKRAEELKQILEYVMFSHVVIAVVKIVLGGLGAGMNDFFSCLILWCGYSRYDYCQTIMYMMMCMQDAFTLFVGLGFWYEKKLVFKAETSARMVKPEGKKE